MWQNFFNHKAGKLLNRYTTSRLLMFYKMINQHITIPNDQYLQCSANSYKFMPLHFHKNTFQSCFSHTLYLNGTNCQITLWNLHLLINLNCIYYINFNDFMHRRWSRPKNVEQAKEWGGQLEWWELWKYRWKVWETILGSGAWPPWILEVQRSYFRDHVTTD